MIEHSTNSFIEALRRILRNILVIEEVTGHFVLVTQKASKNKILKTIEHRSKLNYMTDLLMNSKIL